MAFKLPEKKLTCPDDPEALFRDLRKKTVPGLLSHQADVLRSYIAVHTQYPDIALQLPMGSGKTLSAFSWPSGAAEDTASASCIFVQPDSSSTR
jgi:hypothetical protein